MVPANRITAFQPINASKPASYPRFFSIKSLQNGQGRIDSFVSQSLCPCHDFRDAYCTWVSKLNQDSVLSETVQIGNYPQKLVPHNFDEKTNLDWGVQPLMPVPTIPQTPAMRSRWP